VSVPAPERYAIHKLIVAALRRSDKGGYAKSAKDLAQAGTLISAMADNRRGEDIGFAWIEAWERGIRWQERLLQGARRLMPNELESLAAGVEMAAQAESRSAADFGVPSL
jgi:hypothetical protein